MNTLRLSTPAVDRAPLAIPSKPISVEKPNWQPGQWVECIHTGERGKVVPHEGRAICLSLGDGLTLYASPEALEVLGWRLISA